MKKTIYLLIIGFIILTCSCEDNSVNLEKFSEVAENIEVLNTEYNDFSETIAGFVNESLAFIISSDNNSQGDNLDIKNVFLSYNHNYDNSLTFILNNDGFEYFDSAIVNINSSENESGVHINYSTIHDSDVFLYTSGKSDDSDIYYCIGDYDETKWSEPEELEKLNTDANEQNFTMFNSDILYASDESGDFDIYKIEIPLKSTLREWINSEQTIQKSRFEIMNSSADDICPHISGNYAIFSSNRDGGYGGYDLYYSHYNNGKWSDPVNFGANVNSEYDELNPYTIYYLDHINDIMFFSSNRPEGKGGFDIYYVGILKLTN